MRWSARIGLLVGALALVPVTPAAADSADEDFEALFQATQATAAAARSGVDVVQTIRFSRATDLGGLDPAVSGTVPAGTRLRVHSTVAADGAAYLSVRYQPSGRLLAGAGIDPSNGVPWATVRMLTRQARSEARRAGLPDRTALTDVPATAVADSSVLEQPLRIALELLVPPYASNLDEGWTTIERLPQPDGTTVIRGSIRSGVAATDGEDRCVRPLVEVTVDPDGVIRSSRWTETCPGEGTQVFSAVAEYGPQEVQPATRPRRPASTVLD